MAVPAGRSGVARVHGGRGLPRVRVDDRATEFSRVDESNYKGSATLTAGSRLAIEQNGYTLGAWPITILPDLPPKIEFAKPPQRTQRAALRFEYQASDDYGVESAKAVITRPGDASGEVLALDLPLPGAHLKEAHDASYHDLTAHPWAGLPVDIQLEAVDALGQTGGSEPIPITLPYRAFNHPGARAIAEQGKQLTPDPPPPHLLPPPATSLT